MQCPTRPRAAPAGESARRRPARGLRRPAAKEADSDYYTFEAAKWGVRALARVLLTYQETHGLRTIAALIARWAPPGEHDTAAYIEAVSRRVSRPADQVLDLRDPATLTPLIAAMIEHENGRQPYPPSAIEAGVELALT